MDRKRKNISHTEIYRYWRGKYITDRGAITDESGHGISDEPVIENPGDVQCWCCGKYIDVSNDPRYGEYWDKGDLSRLYGTTRAKSKLNRCHIVPFALDEHEESPSNLFLLCEPCHHLSPDTDKPELFLKWIYRQRHRVLFNGYDINDMCRKFIEECDLSGKDPMTIDRDKLLKTQTVLHNGRISESSVIMAAVDSCLDSKNSPKTKKDVCEGQI